MVDLFKAKYLMTVEDALYTDADLEKATLDCQRVAIAELLLFSLSLPLFFFGLFWWLNIDIYSHSLLSVVVFLGLCLMMLIARHRYSIHHNRGKLFDRSEPLSSESVSMLHQTISGYPKLESYVEKVEQNRPLRRCDITILRNSMSVRENREFSA